jgi:hypothetical protein
LTPRCDRQQLSSCSGRGRANNTASSSKRANHPPEIQTTWR